jgi:hypothetical protein
MVLLCGVWVPFALARSSSALYYETVTSARTLAIDKLSLAAPRTSTEVVEVGKVSVFGIALGGSYIYWSWGGVAGSPSYAGRAEADGSNLDPRFLADSLYPLALAAAGTSGGQ